MIDEKVCARCGKARRDYLSDPDIEVCACDTYGAKSLSYFYVAGDATAPLPIIPVATAWQCPGCKRWKAPHATECDCLDAA